MLRTVVLFLIPGFMRGTMHTPGTFLTFLIENGLSLGYIPRVGAGLSDVDNLLSCSSPRATLRTSRTVIPVPEKHTGGERRCAPPPCF